MPLATKLKYLFIFMVWLCLGSPAEAQNQTISTKGTEFWVGFMENLDLAFNGPPEFSLIVTAEQNATVTITIPATGLSLPFSVNANQPQELSLPNATYYEEGSGVIGNRGIQVTSSQPIQVTAIHYRPFFSESSMVLPATELGYEYLVLAGKDEANTQKKPSQLLIVATQNNTTLTITPSALTSDLRPANQTFSVTLNAGQTYQVQAFGDLSATQIRSDQPVAVFGGATHANICPGSADNHLYDQNFPLNRWGTIYGITPFSQQGGDPIKIIASTDNTEVQFDCSNPITLQKGETYTTTISSPTIVTANQAISIAQFSKSGSCNNQAIGGDPNMLMLCPLTLQAQSAGFFASNRDRLGELYFQNHFINVITRTSATSAIRLDNNPITGFTPFNGNPAFSIAEVSVNPGYHVLTSDSGFQAIHYGFGSFDAYTDHLGYSSLTAYSSNLQIETTNTGNCVGEQYTFTLNTSLNLSDIQWSLGNGTSVSGNSASTAFNQAGNYLIQVTGKDSTGCLYSASQSVSISNCFNGSGTSVCAVGIFPNPSERFVKVLRTNLNIPLQRIELYDMSGRKILSSDRVRQLPDLRTYEFDLVNLAPGAYIVSITCNGQIVREPIILAK